MYTMVLSDGERFSDLSGCRILEIPDDSDPEEIEHVDYREICTFGEATDHDGILVYWKHDVGIVEFNRDVISDKEKP
jgi:hypothetical protein